jgi:hypothetical protein
LFDQGLSFLQLVVGPAHHDAEKGEIGFEPVFFEFLNHFSFFTGSTHYFLS